MEAALHIDLKEGLAVRLQHRLRTGENSMNVTSTEQARGGVQVVQMNETILERLNACAKASDVLHFQESLCWEARKLASQNILRRWTTGAQCRH